MIRGDAADLHTLLKRTIAVDGTFLPALADVAWAVGSRNQHGKTKRDRARIDCQLAVDTFLPELFVITDPGQSETSSPAPIAPLSVAASRARSKIIAQPPAEKIPGRIGQSQWHPTRKVSRW